MDITIERLQAYLQDHYEGRATEQSMFMKLVEEIGEVAEVLNKRAGRKATCGEDHPICLNASSIRLHAADHSVLHKDTLRITGLHRDATAAHRSFQRIQNRLCPIRYRKYTITPFGLQGTAVFFEKFLDAFRGKCRHGAVEKPAIAGNIL